MLSQEIQQSPITAIPIHVNSTSMTQAIHNVFSFDDKVSDINIFTKENILERDDKGRTAIHAACHLGKSNILLHMISLFSDNEEKKRAFSMADNNGATAMHYSCGNKWD